MEIKQSDGSRLHVFKLILGMVPWCEHVTPEESKAYNEAKARAYGWDKKKPLTKPKKKRKIKSRGNQ